MLDPFDANPFLARLIADGPAAPREFALQVELIFIALRVAQLRRVAAALRTGRIVVADWAFLKQQTFAAQGAGYGSRACVRLAMIRW